MSLMCLYFICIMIYDINHPHFFTTFHTKDLTYHHFGSVPTDYFHKKTIIRIYYSLYILVILHIINFR